MPSAEQFRTATAAGVALLWLGFLAVQVRYGEPSAWEYGLIGLVTVLLLVGLVPGVYQHPAYPPASLGICAVALGASAATSGSAVRWGFAALMAVGALVELYNWRTGSELLRLD